MQVLTNGIEVKLQRNALSVIEAPTGNEEDDDLEFDNVQWNGSDMGKFTLLSFKLTLLILTGTLLFCFILKGIVFYLKTISIIINN